ncbi:aldehyde dehydrogenase family protein [Cryobacterium sp. TMT2-23]|nr:aldehyde dehydrogenase family protein [Cryobacterium sp. TMT2-23]
MKIATLKPIIGGNEYLSGSAFDVYEPATGDVIGDILDVGVEGVETAVAAAKKAFPAWRGMTPKDRAAKLLAIADTIDANAEQLGILESRDVGKPLADAVAEMHSAADKYRFFAGAARSMMAPAPGEYKPGITSMVRREPVGVVAALTPWNYPMGLTSWKIAPALAAGNTVVLKPPTEASLTTLYLAHLIADILPAGVLNVVTGRGSTVGAALAGHPDVALVSLTGGTSTGKTIMRQAADTMKIVHLELGGKAPVLVFDDADLDKFSATMKGAVYRNSGQDCTAATRIYAHESIKDEVVERISHIANSLVVGNGFTDPSVEMGPVVSLRQQEVVSGFVDRARATGHARIAAGGEKHGLNGSYYAPTVVTNVRQEDEIVQEEIFGPVVAVSSFGTEEEAIAKANGVAYGLAASVWTRDIDRALVSAARIEAGTVWVNDHGPTTAEMPFGGYKQSGVGRDLSIHAVEEHMHLKHVAVSHGRTL